MITRRTRRILAAAAAAVALYALLGFLALPYAARTLLVDHVERNLGHRLTLGAVRFNPFTFAAHLDDVALSEADGRPLVTSRRIAADLEAASLWRRAWTFAWIEADSPHVRLELRGNGRHNFSALLERLRAPQPRASTPLPRLALGRIAVTEGRLDLSEPPAGESAQLTLAPIAFELTALSSEASQRAPYRLSARTADGERIEWEGELSLAPVAATGRLSLHDWKAATLSRWLGNRIALARADGQADLSFAYDAAVDAGAVALTVTDAHARLSGLALLAPGARAPFASLERIELSGGTLDLAARTFGLESIEIVRPTAALERDAQGRPNWLLRADALPDPAVPTRSTRALPASTQGVASVQNVASVEVAPAPASDRTEVQSPPAAPAWTGRIGRVRLREGDVTLADRSGDSATQIELHGIQLEAGLQATLAAEASALALSGVHSKIATLALRQGAQRLDTGEASLRAGEVNAKLAGSGVDLRASGLAGTLAGLATATDEVAWQVKRVETGVEALRFVFAPEGLDAGLEAATLHAVDIAGGGRAVGEPVLQIAAAQAHADTLALEPGASVPALRVAGVGAGVDALQVRDPAGGAVLARLAHATLDGGSASIAARTLALDRVVLADAHAVAVLDAGGRTNWDGLLAAFGVSPKAPGASGKPDHAAPAWQAQVQSVELRNSGLAFTDQRLDPPLTLALEQVEARMDDAGTDRKRPMRVQIAGRVRDSGQFEAAGQVDPHAPAADLQVKVSGLSAAPLQPYAARHARVKIVSALASANGRLRYGLPKAAGAQLVFEGDFGLDQAVVEETEPAQPLLAVAALRAARARLSVGPNRLEIPDLRLQRLGTRLLIGEDQSVNFARLMRARPQSAETQAATAGTATASDPFPVAISRVRLDDSVLEFTDLSLRPQFHTRMHELQGVITGVSTGADTQARVELEARVDEFGSAQIRGSMNPFKPRRFTSLGLAFHNLEMTALTPYATKFAGYRIATGKLSMDLRYRIRNSALTGENQIVLDRLELGERVESPSALDLPLELAIAILKDENGRIDIGVPVSGSLEDPQFSIAAVVWKAVGNLLGRVVSAPFRALGGIFGSTAEDGLGAIGFQPGAARLAPLERQKLQTVSDALAKRPELTLTVKPFFEPSVDREALRSVFVRADVLERAGIRLEPGEAPGPLDYGDARIRDAIEELFTAAFGLAAARNLRAELAKTRPQSTVAGPEARTASEAGPEAGGDAARSGATSEQGGKAPAGTPAAPTAEAPARTEALETRSATRLARTMVRRLMEARRIDETELSALARRRGEAIAQALREGGKVDPARILTDTPKAVERDGAGTIEAALELGVAARRTR